MNTTIVLNFIRSANAPQISAGVMMKNIPWKSMWVRRGMTPSMGVSTPVAIILSGFSGSFSIFRERCTFRIKRNSPLPT